MHLIELNKRLENDGPYIWIEPHSIEGIDLDLLIENNRKRWLNKRTEDGIETEDEIIVDYLWDCLMEQKRREEENDEVVGIEKINSIALIEAAVFLITKMGSSYAATLLATFRDLLIPEEMDDCFIMLKSALESVDDFRLDILEYFILELFQTRPTFKE